jgi:hypothetical protein
MREVASFNEFVYTVCADIGSLLEQVTALSASESEDSVVVVCGTGYIMPAARAFVGIVEPR